MAHSKTRDLPGALRDADIVVAAVGKAELIRGDWLKPGCTVIDVGFNVTILPGEIRQVSGDVNFKEAKEVAGYITPEPGGVGPMTVAMLMKNTVALARFAASKMESKQR